MAFPFAVARHSYLFLLLCIRVRDVELMGVCEAARAALSLVTTGSVQFDSESREKFSR